MKQLTTLDWARERLANSKRIMAGKSGVDRQGWQDDVRYWRAIVEQLHLTAAGPNAHTLTLEFRRFLSEAEWRDVVERARALPYVVGLTANAVVVTPAVDDRTWKAPLPLGHPDRGGLLL